MFKAREVSIPGIVVVLCILSILLYLYCTERSTDLSHSIKTLDFDGDGKVSRAELKYYLELLRLEEQRKQTDWNSVKKQILGGIMRGFLMGVILSDLDGGLALAFVLGTVNPLIHTMEKSLFA